MKIIFLGTNGWFDDKEGGTVCILIETREEYIIIDAGFGLQHAKKYVKGNKPVYIFISHSHIDHICGLHGLAGFRPKQGFTIICSGNTAEDIKTIIKRPFSFPIKKYKFKINFITVKPGKYARPFNFEVFRLKHDAPTLGIKINDNNKSIVYCCDTAPHPNTIKAARQADVLIHECSLAPFTKDKKWGHTSSDDAARLALKSGVKKLILDHFTPGLNNKKIKNKMLKIAKSIFTKTVLARDGLKIEI